MKSMTGFGRSTFDVEGLHFRVELRTVNSRFLDLKLHHPWASAELDHEAAALLRARLSRGRVDMSVVEDVASGPGNGALRLDEAVATELVRALDQLAAQLGDDRILAAHLLPQPRELLTSVPPAPESLTAAFLDGLAAALDALVSMREREGEGLCADLLAHLEHLGSIAAEISSRSVDEPQRLQQRLEQRLSQLATGGDIDPARLAQEVALVADRCDVSEELARLHIHSTQLGEMLGQKGAVGRKLEFMLQELNRELNTIASKTADARAATLVVEAKGTLEKMREQAQNVE